MGGHARGGGGRGEDLLGVGLWPESAVSETVSIRMERGLVAVVDQAAAETNRSRSQFVRDAVALALSIRDEAWSPRMRVP